MLKLRPEAHGPMAMKCRGILARGQRLEGPQRAPYRHGGGPHSHPYRGDVPELPARQDGGMDNPLTADRLRLP